MYCRRVSSKGKLVIVERIQTTSYMYHPQCNGPVERFHSTCLASSPKAKGGMVNDLPQMMCCTIWVLRKHPRSCMIILLFKNLRISSCHIIHELYKLTKVHKIRTTSYHPQSNGLVERLHSILLNMRGKNGKVGLEDPYTISDLIL